MNGVCCMAIREHAIFKCATVVHAKYFAHRKHRKISQKQLDRNSRNIKSKHILAYYVRCAICECASCICWNVNCTKNEMEWIWTHWTSLLNNFYNLLDGWIGFGRLKWFRFDSGFVSWLMGTMCECMFRSKLYAVLDFVYVLTCCMCWLELLRFN